MIIIPIGSTDILLNVSFPATGFLEMNSLLSVAKETDFCIDVMEH